MLKRLRIKFVCINMAIVTIMLCTVLGLVLYFTQENLESQSLQVMARIAERPMQLDHPLHSPDQVLLPHFSVHLNHQGELISLSSTHFDLSDEAMVAQLVSLAQSGEKSGLLKEYDLRYLRADTPLGERLVFADISGELQTMESLRRTCLLVAVVSFLAFLVISWFLARWAVRPVEAAWTQQKQFLADASHELKTPLTVITTTTELLQDPSCTEADRIKYTDNLLAVSRQMRSLVESLLDLVRADVGSARMTFEPLDYSQLCTSAVLPFEALLFEKDLTLETHIQEDILLQGSADHLRQVVEILLDNAQKYSFPQTEVSVRLVQNGQTCLLTVANWGPAISPADLTNIFRRFYRVDTVRTSSGSYGLGLSIAQAVVHAHKGRIWAESREGVNTFSVLLPTL